MPLLVTDTEDEDLVDTIFREYDLRITYPLLPMFASSVVPRVWILQRVAPEALDEVSFRSGPKARIAVDMDLYSVL